MAIYAASSGTQSVVPAHGLGHVPALQGIQEILASHDVVVACVFLFSGADTPEIAMTRGSFGGYSLKKGLEKRIFITTP
ncbi:MAG: hypothetical protein ACI3VU_00935 [Faecousia sp.]